MNAERFLQHYERIADAPDAIARLRRFILDLAVRGKLVPQDSNDEPADELLKQIAKDKARLFKAREISRLADAKPAVRSDLTFNIPAHWQPAKIEQVLNELQTGPFGSSLHQSDYRLGGTPVVNPASIQDERIEPIEKMAVDALTLERLASFKLRSGDIVMARRGEMGRCAIIREREAGWLCGTGSLILRPSKLVSGEFLVLLIGSPFGRSYLAGSAVGTTMQNLNQTILLRMPFGLPPLPEQNRIVAKVGELMALCDQLEAARTAREQARDRLAVASLARLHAPDAETFQADARFALGALPVLTTRPDQIKQIRQTILNLAVRGKLVPQDARDEPASELLKRLHRERNHKRKFAEINEDDIEGPLPELPLQWMWTTTDQISADEDNAITDGPFGSQLKTDHYIDAPGFRVIRLQNISGGSFREEHRSYIDQARFERLSKHHVKAGDLIVAGLVDPNVRCCAVPAEIGPALVKADCYRFAVHPDVSSRYALHCLNSPLTQGFAAVHHHGMTLTRIGLGNFRRIPFPLPPIAEQHRIVAKVDALMALCDQLEASLTATAATRRRLLDALLAEALAPTDVQAFEAAE